MNQFNLAPRRREIYEEGEGLSSEVGLHLKTLEALHRKEKDVPVPEDIHSYDARKVASEIRDRTHAWFNKVGLEILPYTTFHRDYLNKLLRRVSAAIGGW